MHRLLILSLLFISTTAWAESAPVNVIATFSILGDVVKNVGGAHVNVNVLVGPDGDAHTFEPTPKESIALAQADIIVENGLHFEHFLDDLYKASGSKAKRSIVTADIKPRVVNVLGGLQEADPHAWQSVENVVIMAEAIQKALSDRDPLHATEYAANAAAYEAQLEELNFWIKAQMMLIPEAKRKLLTSHDSLGYYADAYGLKIIGAVISSSTTEAEDPSAQQIAALLDMIKSTGVSAIFTENMHNAKLAKAISNEAHVRIAPSLYTDALGKPGSPGDTYIKMMRYNTTVIVEALQ